MVNPKDSLEPLENLHVSLSLLFKTLETKTWVAEGPKGNQALVHGVTTRNNNLNILTYRLLILVISV